MSTREPQVKTDLRAMSLGQKYWGAMPLPAGATLKGMVTRATGESGALILMPTCRYVRQG